MAKLINRTPLGDNVLNKLGRRVFLHTPKDPQKRPFFSVGTLVKMMGFQREWILFEGFVRHISEQELHFELPPEIKASDITSINREGCIALSPSSPSPRYYNFEQKTFTSLAGPRSLKVSHAGCLFFDPIEQEAKRFEAKRDGKWDLKSNLVTVAKYTRLQRHPDYEEFYCLLNENELFVYVQGIGYGIVTAGGQSRFLVGDPGVRVYVITQDRIIDSMGNVFVKDETKMWSKSDALFNFIGDAGSECFELGPGGPVISSVNV